jgi:hypothetical protein
MSIARVRDKPILDFNSINNGFGWITFLWYTYCDKLPKIIQILG